VEVVVLLLIAIILIGLAIPSLQHVRNGDDSGHTVSNLKQTTLACHGFADVHKKLPPAFDKFGDMRFPASVHIHLLPFVEQDNFYKLFLTAEGKGEITKTTLWSYCSPLDPTSVHDGAGVQNFAANLRVFSDKGLNTAYDADMAALAAIEPGAALFPKSLPDGTSNTMAFATKMAECGDGGSHYAAAPDSNFAAFFGQNTARVPADPSDAAATFQLAPAKDQCRTTPLMAQSFKRAGIRISLFDGSVRLIKPTLSVGTWNLLVQPNDKMELGDDWNN